MELQGPRVSHSRACGLGAAVQHLQKASQEACGAALAACAAYRPDLCIRPAEQGKQTLCPGGRGSRVRDGHNSASREGAQRPARAVTSTVTKPAEREKLSLLPW